MEPKIQDTPIGFALQIIEDASISIKANIKLSEPMTRYLMLAKAYVDRVEDLRLANNSIKALSHDLAIYKEMAGANTPNTVLPDTVVCSER